MTTWRNRLLAAVAFLAVVGAVSVPLAIRSQAMAQAPTAQQATAEDEGVWMEDETPEWKPIEKLTGHFEGYCDGDTPVVTKAPKKTEIADQLIRPDCEDGIFFTEKVLKKPWSPTPGPIDPLANNPKTPVDFSQRASIQLNGSKIIDPRHEIDVYPYITDQGRTLIPARWVVEAAGGRIRWNPKTQEIAVYWQDRQVQMKIGEKTATVNGKSVLLEQPPQIVAGRTMVPVRFVVEGLGGKISWDDPNNRVMITLEGAKCPPAYCVERQREVQAEYDAQNGTE